MKRFAILAILIFFNFQKHVLGYKAAVYEYHSIIADTPKDTILKNLNQYRQYADLAETQGVDILVFPEYGLTTLVKDPTEYAIIINENDTIIQELKAMAAERQQYLVINLLEKEEEPNKTTKYYNTNLVFDKNGNIILKYRKINLFNESKLTPGDANQTLTFTTNFDVTFGIFTSYDILFTNPSQRVLQNEKVTSVVYPTAWSSVMPLLTSLSVQHGYAVANGVNFLAAGQNRPNESMGGSGIFLADGKIAESFIIETSSRKALVQEITSNRREEKKECFEIAPYGLPGEKNDSSIANFITKNDFPTKQFSYKNIDTAGDNVSSEVCHNHFCCTFDILLNTTATTSSGSYKVAAYNGLVEYGDFRKNVKICTLLVCENGNDDSCGARFNGTTLFRKITVESTSNDTQTFFRPVSLNYYLQPITPTAYCYENSTGSARAKFTTLQKQQNVLVFGLMGLASASVQIQAFGVAFLVLCSIVKNIIF